jgi:RNA polymerase sigma-70 factor (ECF subfamily)
LIARYEQDLELVRQLLGGDARAFDRFFHGYFPRLYRFVLPRVSGSYDQAQEVCQRSLVRGVRRLSTYRGDASLFTWLCQIARNELSDLWQRDKNEAARVLHVEDSAAIRTAVESIQSPLTDRPDAVRARSDALRLVQSVLDTLPVNYAEALEWKYLDGLSVAEIADRSGQTLIATQSILARARAAFREEFSRLAGTDLSDLLSGPQGFGSED